MESTELEIAAASLGVSVFTVARDASLMARPMRSSGGHPLFLMLPSVVVTPAPVKAGRDQAVVCASAILERVW